VPYLFTKQGQRIRELQKQISLRALAESTESIHAQLPNGGEAALANLETAQKIVANPSLLASFKKDAELSQKSLVRAVAWLKDLRSEKEAQAAASSIDASTRALLDHEVAFNEIVPTRESLGLDLDLSQKASVADWWLAYAAAAALQGSNKTYSTLTGSSISADAEKALTSASVDRVRRSLKADARKFVAGRAEAAPAVVKYVSGAAFSPRKFNTNAVSASISAASRLIDEAGAIPLNKYTVTEVFTTLVRARNELREIASTLRAEADARQISNEETMLSSSWAVLSQKSSKSEVDSAVSFIQSNNTKANGVGTVAWDQLISETLPTEYSAIEEALGKLAEVVNRIPQDLFEAELKRRNSIVGEGLFANLDGAIAHV